MHPEGPPWYETGVPLLFAPFVAVLFGLLLAYYGRAELVLADRNVVGTRAFSVSLAFTAFVFVPTLGYFAAFHGDWAYLYLVPQTRIPSAVDLSFVLLASSLVPATISYAARHLAEKRTSQLVRVFGILLAITALLGALLYGRLSVSASHAQFRGGFGAVPIGSSPLGRGVLLSWLALGGAAAWARAALRRLA